MIGAYRDFSQLRHEMLAHLAELFPSWTGDVPGAEGDPDMAVVLVEAVAAAWDVVNFYHAARVQEAFVRTATLPQSLADLVALTGYRPAPAASASASQVFILKPGQRGEIPAGFAVKAVTRQGRPELVYETSSALNADAERNALRLAGWNRTSRRLNAVGAPPDSSLLLDQGYGALKAGSIAIFCYGTSALPVKLTAITDESARRRIHWLPAALPANADIPLADLTILGRPKQSMPLAGRARADEITAGERSAHVTSPAILAANHRVVIASEGFHAATRILTKSGSLVTWNRACPSSLRRSQTVIYSAGATPFASAAIARAGTMRLPVTALGPTSAFAQPGDYIVLSDASGEEMVLVAGYSGSTFQLATPVPRAMFDAELYRVRLDDPSGLPGSPKTTLAPVTIGPSETQLTLDRTYEGLAAGAFIALTDGTSMRAIQVAMVDVDEENRTVLTCAGAIGAVFDVAKLSVVGPFELTMRADGYDRADGTLAAEAARLTLDTLSAGWSAGDRLVVAAPGQAEARRVTMVSVEDGRTVLDLDEPLTGSYPLADTVVHGNVATVTHGRSTGEQVAGSGDGSSANQQFRTQKGPVAWTPDSEAPRGVASTLDVIVNGERWTPVETLAESGPGDHHYVEEQDEDRRAVITGGNGRFGAAFLTGRDNIRLRYRVGSGGEGNVAAGEITVMPSPLPFIERTFNATDAAGGADPESAEETRRLARVWVRSLDRAVSAEDFALLALRIPGIAKARAEWTPGGNGRRGLRLTVAATDGRRLSRDLEAAVTAYVSARALPNVDLRVEDARRVPIRLDVEVTVLPSFLRADTQERVAAALADYFSFARRELGEPLFLSEVYALVEQVRGVDHLIARAFHPEGAAPQVLDRIDIDPDAIATGGDPMDTAVGVLHVVARGGLE